MKRITVRVDEETLNAVRRYAVEHHSTGNALIRESITNLTACSRISS